MTAVKSRKSARADVPAMVPSERICNDESKLHEMFEAGKDASHQGDLIILRIPSMPKSARMRHNRQLADGSTQGSRHVMTRGEIFDCDPGEVADLIRAAYGVRVDAKYIGPVFVSPDSPTADDLAHPEHGNQGFPAGAICPVIFQRNLDAEDREARVQD